MLHESTLAHIKTPDLGFGGPNHTGCRVVTSARASNASELAQASSQRVDNVQRYWVLSDGEYRQINALDRTYWHSTQHPQSLDRELIAGQGDDETVQNSVRDQLIGKVYRAWESIQVQDPLHDLDDEQMKPALIEAVALAYSQLFSMEVNPDVCIDAYGEFTFSHKSSAGYVDIGVRGIREISYHVRNDINPELTAFADCEWDLRSLPILLSIAMENLQNAIRLQDSA